MKRTLTLILASLIILTGCKATAETESSGISLSQRVNEEVNRILNQEEEPMGRVLHVDEEDGVVIFLEHDFEFNRHVIAKLEKVNAEILTELIKDKQLGNITITNNIIKENKEGEYDSTRTMLMKFSERDIEKMRCMKPKASKLRNMADIYWENSTIHPKIDPDYKPANK